MSIRFYLLLGLIVIFSCDRKEIIDDIVDANFVSIEMSLTKKISAFVNTVELTIPVKWKVIIQNDSILTVDNQELDDVSKYKIFTLSSYQLSSDSGNFLGDLKGSMKKIVEDKKCCDILDYGVLNESKNIGYNLSEDLEQKELLGSNLFATYLMPSTKYEHKFYFFLSHTYGKDQVENQKVLYTIFNSISEIKDDDYSIGYKLKPEVKSSEEVVRLDSLVNFFENIKVGCLIDCQATQSLSYTGNRNIQVAINDTIVDFTIIGTPLYSILQKNNHYGIITHIDGEVGPYISLSVYDGYLKLVTSATLSSCQGDECYYSLSKALYSSKGVFIIDSEDVIDAPKEGHFLLQTTKYKSSILKSGKVHHDTISRYSSDYNC